MNKIIYTLGICNDETSSACLFINGSLISAVSEERFSRKKYDNAFPNKSIPSLKGKNQTDAATAFLLRDPLLSRAILTAPLRFLKVPTP